MGASQSQQEPQSNEPANKESQSYTRSTTLQNPLKGLIPDNFEDVLKGSDSPIDRSSRWVKVLDQLYAGVFLENKTKATSMSLSIRKYWLEKKYHGNCFMLYARALSVIWGDDSRYWRWVQHKEESGTVIELAALHDVCWLEVTGKLDTRKLSPGILYQASFVVLLKDSARGWNLPISVKIKHPGGKEQEHKEYLEEKPREKWMEIPVSEFVAYRKDVGEMVISLHGSEGLYWKSGLHIQGIAIKPKN